jgi:hypothetical protein
VPVPVREDTVLVTVSVDDRDLGIFDQKTGGEIDSEESKYNPGGMVGEISLGGRRTIGNVTVERYYDALRSRPFRRPTSTRPATTRRSGRSSARVTGSHERQHRRRR